MTTKGASFGYEEVIDLHTESDRVTVIGIHTPTTDTPRRMAPGLFAQFKKFKYLGCSVTMVPAATLPVDPSQVSYEGGEPPIDPRDMLNPILFHGCHGNDLGNILNRIYSAGAVEGSELSQLLHSDSASLWSMLNESDPDEGFPLTVLESLYYRALTDRSWQKANIQRGFRKSGLHPRIYTLATNMQMQNAEYLGANQFPAPAPFSGVESRDPYLGEMWDVDDTTANPVRFFTPRTQRLGWLDTRQVVPYTSHDPYSSATPNPNAEIKDIVKVSTVETKLPRIYMGVILLPPAYKQEQYFRMIITHRFAFAGFRGISMSNLELENPNYFNLNDKMSTGGNDSPDDPDNPDPPVPPSVFSKIRLSNDIGGGAGVYTIMEVLDSGGNVAFKYTAGTGKGIGTNIAGVSDAFTGSPVIFTISGGPYPSFYLSKTAWPDSLLYNADGGNTPAVPGTLNTLRLYLEDSRYMGGIINTLNVASLDDLKAMWKLPVEVV